VLLDKVFHGAALPFFLGRLPLPQTRTVLSLIGSSSMPSIMGRLHSAFIFFLEKTKRPSANRTTVSITMAMMLGITSPTSAP